MDDFDPEDDACWIAIAEELDAESEAEKEEEAAEEMEAEEMEEEDEQQVISPLFI